METRANNSVNVLRNDPSTLTADFWLDEALFPHVKRTFRDFDSV